MKPLIPESFVDVILESREGEMHIQPGYISTKSGELITCRSSYLEVSKVEIINSAGENLGVIAKLGEDALADIIIPKISKSEQKQEHLKPRFYFPDIGENIAILDKPINVANCLIRS